MITRVQLGSVRIVAEFFEAEFCKYSAHDGVRVKIYKVGHAREPIFSGVIGVPWRKQSDIDKLRDAISSAFSFAAAELEERRESTQELSELESAWYAKPYNRERAKQEGH